jgi:hypothetical protein
MAKSVKKKSAKEASEIFHSIMKASVNVPLKVKTKKKSAKK